MHIVQCLSRSIPGGGPTLVLSLVKGIQKQYPAILQSVILPPGGAFVEKFRSLNIEVLEVPLDRITPAAMMGIRKALHALTPSVLHTHGRGAGLFVRLGAVRGRASLVHSYHGVHRSPRPFVQAGLQMLERSLLSKTSIVLSISKGEAADIQNEFHCPPGKIRIIENVIDDGELKKSSTMPLTGRVGAFFRENKGSFVIAMIARDDPVKNYPLAIETARRVLSNSQNTVFVFLGPLQSNELLNDLITEYSSRVILADPDSNAHAILRKSDCLLLSSRKEGRSLTVLEALALGKPIVATNVPGLAEMIRDGVNGILCGEESASLGGALLELSRNKKLRSTLAQRKPLDGSSPFPVWIDQYVRLYEELLDAS